MARMGMSGAAAAFDPEVRTTVHARPGSISAEFSGPNRERYVRVRANALAHAEAHGLVGGADLDAARESLSKALRRLYPADRGAALDHYRRSLLARYVPPVSVFNTRLYVAPCRLVGFDRTEQLRRVARRGGG